MLEKIKRALTKLRTWMISLLAIGCSLFLILRAPIVATIMTSVAIRNKLGDWIKDPYVRLIAAGCLTSLAFTIVFFSFSELGWIIASIGCYEAIDYWITAYCGNGL